MILKKLNLLEWVSKILIIFLLTIKSENLNKIHTLKVNFQLKFNKYFLGGVAINDLC